jgi:hypothetical protein
VDNETFIRYIWGPPSIWKTGPGQGILRTWQVNSRLWLSVAIEWTCHCQKFIRKTRLLLDRISRTIHHLLIQHFKRWTHCGSQENHKPIRSLTEGPKTFHCQQCKIQENILDTADYFGSFLSRTFTRIFTWDTIVKNWSIVRICQPPRDTFKTKRNLRVDAGGIHKILFRTAWQY